MGSKNWLGRYRAGEREAVWWEFRQLGEGVRDPAIADEVQAVCDEMAIRARWNVELIVRRLVEQGYAFHTNDDGQEPVVPWQPPSAGVADTIATLEARWGPLPMTVSSWMRIVGDVWLVGTHPRWSQSNEADPLVIELAGDRYPGGSAEDAWASEHDAWESMSIDDPSMGGFVIPVAPDRLHKMNVSGGPPYGFRLPDACADGWFVAEQSTSFVVYLNGVFGNGGFPGRTANAIEAELKRSLSEGLLDL